MPLIPSTPPNNGKKPVNWGRLSKTVSFWILIILIPVAFMSLQSGRGDPAPLITYSRYDGELAHDNISRVTIQAGRAISGEFKQRVNVEGKDVKKFNVRLPIDNSEDEVKRLRDKGVQIEAQDAR